MRNNSTGNQNVALGEYTLIFNTTGQNNTAVGGAALNKNMTGVQNTGVGADAGNSKVPGNNNTYVGFNANASADNFNNAAAIGANAVVNATNTVRIGDAGITVIEGQVAWSYPSDRRLKEHIVYSDRLGLDFITRLQTVSYNYISDKTKVRHNGFIAQDIEAIMKELKVDFSGLKKSEDGTYSLAYSDFIMPPVNAVKEQQQEIKALREEITDLKSLKVEMAQLKTMLKGSENHLPNNDKK